MSLMDDGGNTRDDLKVPDTEAGQEITKLHEVTRMLTFVTDNVVIVKLQSGEQLKVTILKSMGKVIIQDI